MKILCKIPYLFTGIAVLCLVIISCNKPDMIVSAREGNIYMPAAAVSGSFPLLLADTAQSIPFGAAYGGLKYPGQDITIGFKVDTTLVSSYNAAHGSAYTTLPASAYQVPSLSAVIKAGQTSSNTLSVKITTSGLDKSLKYIIPVSITTVTSGFIDSSLNTAYFTIDTIKRLEKDITSQATLTVSRENSGGSGASEGSPKLVDGDYSTKFLTDGFPQAFWVQLTFPSAQKISAYTITSGNDSPDRDMKDWNLSGSNDGSSWTVLDTQAGEMFADRNMTKRYDFNNAVAYTQYRINVIANNGSNLIQVSEWRLITFP
jgi:hypothetical protein